MHAGPENPGQQGNRRAGAAGSRHHHQQHRGHTHQEEGQRYVTREGELFVAILARGVRRIFSIGASEFSQLEMYSTYLSGISVLDPDPVEDPES